MSRICYYCMKETDDGQYCTFCGKPLETNKKPKKKRILLTSIAILFVFLAIGMGWIAKNAIKDGKIPNISESSDDSTTNHVDDIATDNNQQTANLQDSQQDNTAAIDEEGSIDQPETRQTKSLEDYFSEVDGYVKEGKYTEALAVLETAERKIDAPDIITKKRYDVNKERVLHMLEQYDSTADLIGAIQYIREELPSTNDDEEILTKLNIYISNYRDQILTEAADVFKTDGYKKAVEIVEEGLQILNDDSELIKKKSEYLSYTPVRLKSLDVTSANGYSFNDSMSDTRSEVDQDVILLDYFIEFYTAGEYSTFTATIDPVYYFDSSAYQGAQLQIIADNEIVYQSPTITYRTDDLEISVDIKHADYLGFQLVYVGGSMHSEYWDADPILLYNAFVSK